MAIYIDDQAADIAATTLADALAAATTQLEPAGRVVVEVVIDGNALNSDELDAAEQTSVEQAEVKLYSADPRELAVATLMQIQEQLGKAGEVQNEAADLLQQDRAAEAMEMIGQSLQLWQQTGQAVLQSAQLLGINLDEQKYEGKAIADMTQDLLVQLRSLAEMIAAGDTVGLADALAYEWPDTTKQWSGLVGQMINLIDA